MSEQPRGVALDPAEQIAERVSFGRCQPVEQMFLDLLLIESWATQGSSRRMSPCGVHSQSAVPRSFQRNLEPPLPTVTLANMVAEPA